MRRRVTPLISIVLLTLVALWSVNGAAEATGASVPAEVALGTATAPASVAVDLPTPRPTFTPTPTVTATPTAAPTAASTPAPTATPTREPSPAPQVSATLPTRAQSGKAIIIDQAEQVMYLYEDGELVRTVPVSTGRPTSTTYTPAWEGRVGHYVGTFSSFGTTQDEGWFLFQSDGGILIHGNPYLMVDSVKVYQELEALGQYPASHGCIRVSPEDSAWFTAWNPQGAYCAITAMPKSAFQ